MAQQLHTWNKVSLHIIMPFNLVFTYKLHYIFGVFSKMPESNTEKKERWNDFYNEI